MIKRQLKTLLFLAFAAVAWQGASAQHTLGFTAGYGMASSRLDPKQEMKKDYRYYTRNVNSIVLPIVWQPHFYLFRNHVRVYLEAAATFSYHLSSTYENEEAKASGAADWKGDYSFKLPRDNRWGYGLAGGGGIALLIRRFEINVRARYYFGLSDIVRNRNKYADNGIDGSENPFWATPMRSPLDNLTVSVGLSYRFNKEGFSTWKPRPKREKNREVFKYGL